MKKYSTKNINDQLMPVANEIKDKFSKLQEQYKFNMDFAFPEITLEEIIGKNEKEDNA